MGCVETITHDKFPKQKDENYKYPQYKVGSRVKVCYHYNTEHCHYGTIVRDDLEAPFETIIKLDNGRYLRGVECQFSYTSEPMTNADRIRNMTDEELAVYTCEIQQLAIDRNKADRVEDALTWLQSEVKEGESYASTK